MGIAIAALVVGICSLLAAILGGALGIGSMLAAIVLLIIAVVGGIVGIILSALTMKNVPEKKGFGIGGLVTSIIGLIYGAICLVACVACAYACGTAASALNKAATESVNEMSPEDKEKAEKAINDFTDVAKDAANNTTTENAPSSSGNTDFRKWVDDYEKWVNDYVDFMNNYNPSDISQLSKYSKLMSDYSKWASEVNNLKESEYSTDDWAYYLAAQGRITEKLSSISAKMMNQ